MGLDDAIRGLGEQLARNSAAWNEQNSEWLHEKQDQARADQAFAEVVLTQIMPVFNRVTSQLDGAWTESLYGNDIQLVVKGQLVKHSLYYRPADDRQVMVAKLVMDGNGTPTDDSPVPVNELTQRKVEAHVEDFLNWCKTMIAS